MSVDCNPAFIGTELNLLITGHHPAVGTCADGEACQGCASPSII